MGRRRNCWFRIPPRIHLIVLRKKRNKGTGNLAEERRLERMHHEKFATHIGLEDGPRAWKLADGLH